MLNSVSSQTVASQGLSFKTQPRTPQPTFGNTSILETLTNLDTVEFKTLETQLDFKTLDNEFRKLVFLQFLKHSVQRSNSLQEELCRIRCPITGRPIVSKDSHELKPLTFPVSKQQVDQFFEKLRRVLPLLPAEVRLSLETSINLVNSQFNQVIETAQKVPNVESWIVSPEDGSGISELDSSLTSLYIDVVIEATKRKMEALRKKLKL